MAKLFTNVTFVRCEISMMIKLMIDSVVNVSAAAQCIDIHQHIIVTFK